MKVAFIYQGDVNNQNSFSGIPYNLYNHLLKSFDEIKLISPIEIKHNNILRIIFKLNYKLCSYITGKTCLNYYLNFMAKQMSSVIDMELNNSPVDLIISTGVDPFVYCRINTPMIQITGGTVRLLYEDYSSSTGWSRKYISWLENRSINVMNKCRKIICASDYCASSLLNDYNVNKEKIAVIPYGTNLSAEQKIVRVIQTGRKIKFLFVGKEWLRKGGDDTVRLCDELKKMGLDIELVVVGSKVPVSSNRNYIINYEYLDKENTEEYKLLINLYTTAHFFILPTKAEFFGVVFSEAAAFSIPVISRNICPINEIVLDNETGVLINNNPDIHFEAKRIYELIDDNNKYQKISENAYNRYRKILNWDAYVISLKKIIDQEF